MLHLNLVLIYCQLLFMNYYLSKTSLCLFFSFFPTTLEGPWGITDEFLTIPFHLVLFSAAQVELAKSIPVHSLINIVFPPLLRLFILLNSVASSLLNQKTIKPGQTTFVSVS